MYALRDLVLYASQSSPYTLFCALLFFKLHITVILSNTKLDYLEDPWTKLGGALVVQGRK